MVRALAHLVQVVEVAAQPAVAEAALYIRCFPDGHGGEVREVGTGIADALHDRKLSRVPLRLEGLEVWVQAELVVEGQDTLILAQGRPGIVLGRVLEWDHRVEAVVAAGKLPEYQDLVARRGMCRVDGGCRPAVRQAGWA